MDFTGRPDTCTSPNKTKVTDITNHVSQIWNGQDTIKRVSPEDDQSILIETSSWNQRFFSEPPQLIRESNYMVLPQTFLLTVFNMTLRSSNIWFAQTRWRLFIAKRCYSIRSIKGFSKDDTKTEWVICQKYRYGKTSQNRPLPNRSEVSFVKLKYPNIFSFILPTSFLIINIKKGLKLALKSNVRM